MVHDWRGSRGKGLISRAEVVEIEEDYVALAADAESMDDLMDLYHRAVAAGKWDDELRTTFSVVKTTLERAS